MPADPIMQAAINPAVDWIGQIELARLLGVSQKTVQNLAKRGRLRQFEHGISAAGRRVYSRELVRQVIETALHSGRRDACR